MTIFTALGLVIGVGALMHEGENGSSLFGGSGNYRAQPDTFTLRAGRVQSLDVLLNDTNADLIDPDQLTIVQNPQCGMATPVAGTIQFSDSAICSGQVELSYCVPFNDACDIAIVTLSLLNVERTTPRSNTGSGGAADGEPLIMTEVSQGQAPSQQQRRPQVGLRQPVRIEVPSNSEVITPAAAVASIRSRDNATSVVAQQDVNDKITVSQTSARSGRVSTGGVEMLAPSLEGENSNILIAGAQPVTGAPRTAQPFGLSPSPQGAPTGLPNTQFSMPTPPSSPSRPVAPGETVVATVPVPVAPVVPTPPVITATPTKPAETVIASVAPDAQQQVAEPNSGSNSVEASHILATSSRDDSFLGVAARVMLSPTETEVAAISTGDRNSAPRPTGLSIAEQLRAAGNNEGAITRGALPQIESRVIQTSKSQPAVVASLDLDKDTDSFEDISRIPAPPAPREIVEAPTPIVPEVDTPVVASLEVDIPAIVEVFPETTADSCGIQMNLKDRAGAEMVATVVSPCRPGQQFEVGHAGLVFSAETDLDGVANFIVPAMQRDARVTIEFKDGARAEETIAVSNMDRVERVAVMWSADVDFDLHVLEFGAQHNSQGHVWSQAPSDYRSARRSGGGYMTALGPVTGSGNKAEVYTIIRSSRTKEGLIDLSLEVAGFGPVCEESVIVKTVRSSNARIARDRDMQFSLGDCSASFQSVRTDAIQDIRISRR